MFRVTGNCCQCLASGENDLAGKLLVLQAAVAHVVVGTYEAAVDTAHQLLSPYIQQMQSARSKLPTEETSCRQRYGVGQAAEDATRRMGGH